MGFPGKPLATARCQLHHGSGTAVVAILPQEKGPKHQIGCLKNSVKKKEML